MQSQRMCYIFQTTKQGTYMARNISNPEGWVNMQETPSRKRLSFEIGYWENHALGILCATAQLTEDEYIKNCLIEKINSYGSNFELTVPKRKPIRLSFFAILQELVKKAEGSPRIKRMILARLNKDVSR